MDVITVDTAAYQKLEKKLDIIMEFIQSKDVQKAADAQEDEMWVDNYDVCTFLKISERTLQRLRTTRKITYSRIDRHVYYQIKEIRRMLYNHLVRSNEEYLHDLVENQKLYAEQRRAARTHK